MNSRAAGLVLLDLQCWTDLGWCVRVQTLRLTAGALWSVSLWHSSVLLGICMDPSTVPHVMPGLPFTLAVCFSSLATGLATGAP